MKTILVTGGAGYIGSIAVRRLLERGYAVIVLDNLSRGNKASLPEAAFFVQGDIADEELLEKILTEHTVDAVMHFAAYAYVGESVQNPSTYFENNLRKSMTFLDCVRKYGIKKIIFSSSCATYGVPEKVPITEAEKQNPINPYGLTKYLFEKTLQVYDEVYGIKWVSLRYFNAAGAAYGIGEDHRPETHIIPLALGIPLGKKPFFEIFGEDYPTSDGTCIRDYLHVLDIADAHILALQHMEKGKSASYNLGSGKGYSVKEILELCREVTGHPIPIKAGKRREGDPPRLVASSEIIEKEIGWKAKYSMKEIIESAWEWHRKNPKGFLKN